MPSLDAQHQAFIQSAVSISAASRAADGTAVLARSHGCALSGASRVRLVFTTAKAHALLEAIRATGVIAVGYNEPSTHRSIQLKGDDAAVVDATPADAELALRYIGLMATELRPHGYSEEWVRALLFAAPGDLAAVEFTPTRAFAQTPGPRAGTPLEMR